MAKLAGSHGRVVQYFRCSTVSERHPIRSLQVIAPSFGRLLSQHRFKTGFLPIVPERSAQLRWAGRGNVRPARGRS